MTNEKRPVLLFDLLNQETASLLRQFDKQWAAKNNTVLSASEWLILSRVIELAPSIADVAKNVHITRQATHKCIKSLEAKGLIATSTCTQNRRVKLVSATELGKQYHSRSVLLKKEIETNLLATLGTNKIEDLKDLLHTISIA